MIDKTDTEFFLIVDGDEIHYKAGMEGILSKVKNWNPNFDCVNIPIIWFHDLENEYSLYGNTGRIFKTENVYINDVSPGEMAINRKTKKVLTPTNKNADVIDIYPFAHFETMLKSQRRKVDKSKIFKSRYSLPEVMLENKFYLERFLNGN